MDRHTKTSDKTLFRHRTDACLLITEKTITVLSLIFT